MKNWPRTCSSHSLSYFWSKDFSQRAENGGLDPSWLDLAFLGLPDFQSTGPKGPKILILKGFGTSGRKIGAPQKNAKSNHDGSTPPVPAPLIQNPTPLKPHPCNMPQAKKRSCAAIFGKLRCRNCTATPVRMWFLPKVARCNKLTEHCTATLESCFAGKWRSPAAFLRISSSHV